jgi:hypothetical protein
MEFPENVLRDLEDSLSRMIRVSSWEPVDIDSVLRGERVTLPPAVLERSDGVKLIYPGRLNVFMGDSESCKTWIADAAVAAELNQGHHVIILDYEDSAETTVERLRSLGVSADNISAWLTYTNPAGKFDELAEAVLQEAIKGRGDPTLAVVDGVTEAMADIGLDPISGPDVATFYGGAPRWLAHTGAAVTLIDHVTKSTEGRGRWAIGSERKISGLDGAAYGFDVIEPFGRGRTGKVKMTVSKDRLGHIRQHEGPKRLIALIELQSWPDGGVTINIDPPDPESSTGFKPTHLMEKVSKVITAQPGLSITALRKAVGGGHGYIDLALELLILEEFVEVRKGTRNAQQHYSVRPYKAVDG